MSAPATEHAPATARRLSAPPQEHVREPRLRLVPAAPTAAPKLPFVVVVVTILTAGLLSLLMLNTLAAQDAFRLHDLQKRSSSLADDEQQVRLALDSQSAPSNLAARARAMGMLPAQSPAFLRLRDGRIVGVATAAPSPPPPTHHTSSPSTARTGTPLAGPSASHSRGAAPARAGHGGQATTARAKHAATTTPGR